MAALVFIAVGAGFIGSVPKVLKWTADPRAALPGDVVLQLGLFGLGLGALTAVGVWFMRKDWASYAGGFLFVYVLAIIAYTVAAQVTMSAWGLGYALWALFLGLLISNTVGTPKLLLHGAQSELFIKTGLVLLGGEILFSEILNFGAAGLLVAWVVTPVVIIFMWKFGTSWLNMASRPLTIVVAAATSVCGVSAAIATAAACNAKKQELTLAVGMTMMFTVAMMVGMPALSRSMGLSDHVAGAWLGGTIDATGAVVAAGAILGPEAEKVAAVVKMIQNILIGVVAFLVALYWVTRVERDPTGPRPSPMEIWYRFPKFILGFALASLVFSFVLMPALGDEGVNRILNVSKAFRGWFFCFAFVSIGLESNFKELVGHMAGGKPLVLYVVGQSFNILLTLLMAWLAFGGILFPELKAS